MQSHKQLMQKHQQESNLVGFILFFILELDTIIKKGIKKQAFTFFRHYEDYLQVQYTKFQEYFFYTWLYRT